MIDYDNQQIVTDSLPRLETVEYEPLQKNYLWMSMVQNAIFLMVLFGVGLIFTLTVFLSTFFATFLKMLGIWILFATLLILLTYFGFKRKGYALRERDISYKTGLIFKSVTTIPFNRVQHCELKKGPLEELFSITKLRVYTAGGMASDLAIPGLTQQRAESLKQFILNKTEEDEEE